MTISPFQWTPPVQWGSATGGVWTDITPSDDAGGDIRLVTGGTTGGVIVSAGIDTVLVGGDARALDGPVVVTFQFHFHPIAEDLVGPYIVQVGLVPDPQPANYSNSLLPWSRNEILMLTETFDDPPLVPLIGVDHHETGFLDPLVLRYSVTSKARWNGRIAFSFRSTGPSVVRIKNGPNFSFEGVGTAEQAFTGLVGYGREHGRVRAVRDTRFGIPTLSNRLVRDGDRPGLWVLPMDHDEKDPARTYRPSPREGVRDDEVPS